VRNFSFDVPRVLMIGGGALLILGLAFIGLAWYGAAHTPYLFEQVPYLISGGLLGLGLAFAGGFMYFAYWLTRLVRDNRQEADRAVQALAEIKRVLQNGGPVRGTNAQPEPGSAAATRRGAGAGGDRGNGAYVATARGTMFHRPECPIVAGRSDLRYVDAEGFSPCSICDPLGKEASATVDH
jgi:hypothetical protein